MFNIEFLHVIREFEYKEIIDRLPAGSRILEIGGGTGYQAKRLTEDGYSVESIDIQNSNYADQKEFPVKPYDGRNIPFPDASFDVVINVESCHAYGSVPNFLKEVNRVLRPAELANVHLLDPLSVREFIRLFRRAVVVLSDSGGVQEEAPTLGVPVLLMRDTTERPEAVDAGVAKLVGTSVAAS